MALLIYIGLKPRQNHAHYPLAEANGNWTLLHYIMLIIGNSPLERGIKGVCACSKPSGPILSSIQTAGSFEHQRSNPADLFKAQTPECKAISNIRPDPNQGAA